MLNHYVCIKCRKGFKKDFNTNSKCPQCGEKMYWVNTDFRIPKQTNNREWKKISKMLRYGKRFKHWWQNIKR